MKTNEKCISCRKHIENFQLFYDFIIKKQKQKISKESEITIPPSKNLKLKEKEKLECKNIKEISFKSKKEAKLVLGTKLANENIEKKILAKKNILNNCVELNINQSYLISNQQSNINMNVSNFEDNQLEEKIDEDLSHIPSGCKHKYKSDIILSDLKCCKDSSDTCIQCYFKKRHTFQKCFYCNNEINKILSKNLEILKILFSKSDQNNINEYKLDSWRYIKCQECRKKSICLSGNCCDQFKNPICYTCLFNKLNSSISFSKEKINCPYKCNVTYSDSENICAEYFGRESTKDSISQLFYSLSSKNHKYCNSCYIQIHEVYIQCCKSFDTKCLRCYLRKYHIIHQCAYCKKGFPIEVQQKLKEKYNELFSYECLIISEQN